MKLLRIGVNSAHYACRSPNKAHTPAEPAGQTRQMTGLLHTIGVAGLLLELPHCSRLGVLSRGLTIAVSYSTMACISASLLPQRFAQA